MDVAMRDGHTAMEFASAPAEVGRHVRKCLNVISDLFVEENLQQKYMNKKNEIKNVILDIFDTDASKIVFSREIALSHPRLHDMILQQLQEERQEQDTMFSQDITHPLPWMRFLARQTHGLTTICSDYGPEKQLSQEDLLMKKTLL